MAEIKLHPEKARQYLRAVLAPPDKNETMSPMSRSHITVMSIIDLRDLGDIDEAKVQLRELIPKFARQVEMNRVRLLEKADTNRLESFFNGCRDLICCYALAGDKKSADEVLRAELKMLATIGPDDASLATRARNDYEQAMKTEPVH